MSDEVLSQNEIDALLSAITSGEMDADELKKEEEEQRIREYDFKRALRFSKDQIRSIERVHENYARLLTTFFSGQLRTYVNITVGSVDQLPYEEFVRSIPEMTILNVYSVEPLEGMLIMEVNPNIAFSMMDRLLGGKGTNAGNTESLTEIETLIINQLFEKAVFNLKDAWSTIVDIDPMLEEFEVNPQFLQMVSPNDTVVVVSLNTQIGDDVSGVINICIPHIVLEPVIPKLSAHYWMENTSKERDPESYAEISHALQETEVEATAVLGQSSMTLSELLHLNKGDVIALNQSIDAPLELLINEESKMLVQPGKRKNKVAIQVLEEIKRGE